MKTKTKKAKSKIRYAVVGLGWIAQTAVLPAFSHAKTNSQLKALVSGDPDKLRTLGKLYGIKELYDYDQFFSNLKSLEIDAVYIALPNHLHAEFSMRAAEAGVHILCEKPMAITVNECARMIHAAHLSNVKLMIAYRLHFERANLQAIEITKSGKLGQLRIFNACFTMQVKVGNIRTKAECGGGPLFDLGVYCINAARYIFADEPIQVSAMAFNSGDSRFTEVDETISAVLRFPDQRVANFTCSFGTSDASYFEVIGTKGRLRVDPAFEYQEALVHHLYVNGKSYKKTFSKRDQFAAELIYFSDCILNGKDPAPIGAEGLEDVKIMHAIHDATMTNRSIVVDNITPEVRPNLKQEIRRPPLLRRASIVNVESPSIS